MCCKCLNNFAYVCVQVNIVLNLAIVIRQEVRQQRNCIECRPFNFDAVLEFCYRDSWNDISDIIFGSIMGDVELENFIIWFLYFVACREFVIS